MDTTLNLALDELKAQRNQLREQLELVNEAMESLERVVRSQKAAVRIDIPRRPVRSARPGVPSGPEGVRLVLAAHPGECLSVKQITEELMSRGWAGEARDPVNATSSNALVAMRNYPEEISRERERGTTAFLYCYRDDAQSEGPDDDASVHLGSNGHDSPTLLENIAASPEELVASRGEVGSMN